MRFQLQPTRWADLKDQMPLILRKYGARGGGRTHTALTGQGILSPLRLPVPPPRLMGFENSAIAGPSRFLQFIRISPRQFG